MNREQIRSLLSMGGILVVTIAGLFGISLDESTGETIAMGVAIVALVAYGCWKNHNLTMAAVLGQKVLDAVKQEVITPEQVENFIDEATKEQQH